MKKFFLKKHVPDNITRLDPVAALEERFKSIEMIVDPAERLLELDSFFKECGNTRNKISSSKFGKFFLGGALTGAAVGATSAFFIGPLAVCPFVCIVLGGSIAGSLDTPAEKKIRPMENIAKTMRDALIKTGDLKMLVASPLFDAAVLEFPQLKERFQLAAQKAAFLDQDKSKSLPQPQKPDDGLRM